MKANINAIVVTNDSHRIICDVPFYVRENNIWKSVTVVNKSASLIAGFKPMPKFDLEVSECKEPKTGYRVVPKYRLDVEEMEPLASRKDLDSRDLCKTFNFIKVITIMYGTISLGISDKWEYAIPFDDNSNRMMMICCEWNHQTYSFDEYGRQYILKYRIDTIDLNIDEDFKLINVSVIPPIEYSVFPEPCKNFKADRKKPRSSSRILRKLSLVPNPLCCVCMTLLIVESTAMRMH